MFALRLNNTQPVYVHSISWKTVRNYEWTANERTNDQTNVVCLRRVESQDDLIATKMAANGGNAWRHDVAVGVRRRHAAIERGVNRVEQTVAEVGAWEVFVAPGAL